MNDWARACVDRLTYNYDWQDTIDPEDWEEIQRLMAEAINSNKDLAKRFSEMCNDNGVIEDDYFSF